MKESSAFLFRRYMWLTNIILDAGPISLQEINEKWRKSSINDMGEDSISPKTFYRHKEAVEELFSISIKCRKSDNTYYIEDNLETDDLKKWLLNSFSVYNLLQEGYDMKDVILFEQIPSGTEYLLTILKAIKSSHTLKIEHKKFKDDESKTFEAEPYCLKVDKKRWYVLAKKIDGDKKKTYALDRIQSLEITDNTYIYPEDFSPRLYFENSFGIYPNEDKKIEKVVIKATNPALNYIRTLPLHSSQKEEKHEEYSIFKYNIKTDKEFKSELLKWGSSIKVLEPLSLHDDMVKEVKKLSEIYNS